MKFIIGLGNIGREFENTRHNAGFLALDSYVGKREMGAWSEKPKLQAMIIQNQSTFFIKPTTYMNLSGNTIAMAMAFYKVSPEDILIVHDDIDIDFGAIRIRQGGSDGGHNGIKSLPNSVQDSAWRIRIGVKNEHLASSETADFVLSDFSKTELLALDEILNACQQQVDNFLDDKIKAESLKNLAN